VMDWECFSVRLNTYLKRYYHGYLQLKRGGERVPSCKVYEKIASLGSKSKKAIGDVMYSSRLLTRSQEKIEAMITEMYG
jgi:hypothetical protein